MVEPRPQSKDRDKKLGQVTQAGLENSRRSWPEAAAELLRCVTYDDGQERERGCRNNKRQNGIRPGEMKNAGGNRGDYAEGDNYLFFFLPLFFF